MSSRFPLAIWLVLLLALSVRLGAAWWWQQRLSGPAAFAFPDSHTYWELAERLYDGRPYEFGDATARIFRAPGYPLALSTVFWLWGGRPPVFAARVLGCGLGTLTVAGLMALGYQLGGPRLGLWAGLLSAVYPGAVGMSVFVLSEAAFCPLMVLQLVCWTKAWRPSPGLARGGWAVGSGVAAGGATLCRPSWLLFVPLALVACGGWWLVCRLVRPGRLPAGGGQSTADTGGDAWTDTWTDTGAGRLAWVAVATLAGLCLAMSPWWLRSYRITGTFVPTTLQVGASLYDGVGPQADGGSNMAFALPIAQDQRREDRAAGRGKEGFELRLDRRMRKEAWRTIAADPGRVGKLAVVKFSRMWTPWPRAEGMVSLPAKLIVLAGYLPLLALTLWGVWRYGGQGPVPLLLALPLAYFTLLHVIFVSSIRYRQPALLVGTVLAAGILAGCRRLGRGTPSPRPAVAAAAVDSNSGGPA